MECSDQERPPAVSNQAMSSGPTNAEQLLFICIVQNGVAKEMVNMSCLWITDLVQDAVDYANSSIEWSCGILQMLSSFRGLADERSHSFDFTKCTTTAKVRQYIKEAIASIGYDPVHYSGHSPRAGGATDLFLDGVSHPTIKEFGRWKSDAALLYYRSEYKVAYLGSSARISTCHPYSWRG